MSGRGRGPIENERITTGTAESSRVSGGARLDDSSTGVVPTVKSSTTADRRSSRDSLAAA